MYFFYCAHQTNNYVDFAQKISQKLSDLLNLFIYTQNLSFFRVFWLFLTKKYLFALNFGYFVIYLTIKSDLNVVQS